MVMIPPKGSDWSTARTGIPIQGRAYLASNEEVGAMWDALTPDEESAWPHLPLRLRQPAPEAVARDPLRRLSLAEASERLGVSKKVVARLVHENRLRCIHLGRRLTFKPVDVDAVLGARPRQRTRTEIERARDVAKETAVRIAVEREAEEARLAKRRKAAVHETPTHRAMRLAARRLKRRAGPGDPRRVTP